MSKASLFVPFDLQCRTSFCKLYKQLCWITPNTVAVWAYGGFHIRVVLEGKNLEVALKPLLSSPYMALSFC